MPNTNTPLPGNREKPFTFDKGNQGLYFNKFFNQWDDEFSKVLDPSGEFIGGKQTWIKNNARKTGNDENLSKASKRIAELAKKLSECDPVNYVTTGPFITGMGLSNPIENGFLWHHTLSVPYLPGSSIKGMIRAWLCDWCGLEKDEDGYDEHINVIARLFGGPIYEPYKDVNGKEKQKEIRPASVGNIIVFDALPVGPISLYAEVLTQHDGGWRIAKEPTENDAPADWISPIPIPFLAVEEGAEFQFALALRCKPTKDGEPGPNEGDLEAAYKHLNEALQWIGAGAKTAVGFGRFESTSAQLEEQKNAELAAVEHEKKRPPRQADRVLVLPTFRNAKWHGAHGIVLDNPEVNGMLKVKRDLDENGKRPELYIPIDELARIFSGGDE